MSCEVIGQILPNSANISEFLQICVHLLIARHGQGTVVGLFTLVLLQDAQGNVQQAHVDGHTGLMALGDNPIVAVQILLDMFVFEQIYVYVRQPRPTGKYKDVAHPLQAFHFNLLVHNALEFVHCQKAFVHLNEGDGLREWVELDKTGVPCAGNGFLEQLHHLRGGVVADLLVHTQEVAEAVDKFLVDFRQWNVFILFFPEPELNVFFHTAVCQVVFLVGVL